MWSLDADEAEPGPLDLYDRLDHDARDATATQQAVDLARETDRVYQYPPTTAGQWTCGAFRDLPAERTDWQTSQYPASADRQHKGPIRDAHATIFAVTPQTVAHRASGTTRYVPASGQVLALADYRVAVPSTTDDSDPPGENVTYRRVTWTYVQSNVTSVALIVDGQRRQRREGQPTPSFEYSIAGQDGERVTLEVQAEIRAVLRKRTTETRRVYDERTNETEVETHNSTRRVVETLTVSDTRTVKVAHFTAADVSLSSTTAPGTVERHHRAVHVTAPWAGYTDDGGGTSGWTGWNFYTARNPAWDTRTVASATSTRPVDSRARPVVVHAYPADFGPFTETMANGSTTRVRGVWGPTRESGPTVPETVRVEPATESYTEVQGMLVQHRGSPSRSSTTVYGIVPGQQVSLDATGHTTRRTRESNLSATATPINETAIELTITLRDATSGTPIGLGTGAKDRRAPLTKALGPKHNSGGVIVVQGATVDRRYRPSDGRLSVTLPRGEYNVEYRPASWVAVDPAYTRSSTTVQTPPVSRDADILSIAVFVFVAVLPMAVVYYLLHRGGALYDTIADRPRP